jgi:hypothetical protein
VKASKLLDFEKKYLRHLSAVAIPSKARATKLDAPQIDSGNEPDKQFSEAEYVYSWIKVLKLFGIVPVKALLLKSA